MYWSKGLPTQQSFLVNGEVVYNHKTYGGVRKPSLQTGMATFQGQAAFGARLDGLSYVYDNHFHCRTYDSLYRADLVDGSARVTKVAAGDYRKLTLVGKTEYASTPDYSLNNGSRIILQADNLLPKDSVRIPAQYSKVFQCRVYQTGFISQDRLRCCLLVERFDRFLYPFQALVMDGIETVPTAPTGQPHFTL